MSLPADYFDELFADSDDPWAFRTRWYEQRKRDLTLAALPRQRYERAFEPGCANGELSVALAQRCDSLVCMDLCPRAVELAVQRLKRFSRARVVQGRLPEDWPEGAFDLIVVSEWAYYLTPASFIEVIDHMLASLTPDGAVLACHWLQPIDGCAMTGREAHSLLHSRLRLHRTLRHEEPDFLLEVWSRQPGGIDLDEQVREA
ncbi:class I SAM-dependent DNA methyltransferase [Pseudomonas sp. NPDC090203]|uniref:class I SAM-dependent DNA methyltransferase n=1 Tax=Pseudomonas sp. NPDC090203 TaxID=3364477 RepID=UPI0037FE038D